MDHMSEDIKFDSTRIPEKRLTVLSAYISDVSLLMQGKKFLHEVLAQLVRQSVTVHRMDIDNMITEIIMSSETREYIQNKIRETIDKQIQIEIEEMFKHE